MEEGNDVKVETPERPRERAGTNSELCHSGK